MAAVIVAATGVMRICILCPDRPSQGLNGPRRIAEESAVALASLGHEIHLVGHAEQGARVECVDGVWHHRVEIADRRLPQLQRCPVALELYAAAAKYQEVLRLHASSPVDLVVAAIWPGEGLVCLHDQRLATATVLVTPVKLTVERGMLTGEPYESTARIERAVIERSEHVHITTRAIAADTEAVFGIPPLPRSEVVPLFTADRSRGAGLERYAGPEEIEVLFVGRPEPRKGGDVLIAAAQRLAHEWPSARYVFVGQGNWEDLNAAAEADADLRGRSFFVGGVDEARLWRLYAGADLVCVPSRYESFGYALVEAMMFGKPLVATDVGGMSATVEAGENALLCPPDDPQSLASCLARLFGDPDLRNRYGRRSRELYEEHYSMDRGAERTAALYARMAADHRLAHPSSPRLDEPADGRTPIVPPTVIDSLAKTIAEATTLEPEAARELARQLLDGTCYPAAGGTQADDPPIGSANGGPDHEHLLGEWQERALEAERQNAELRHAIDVISRSKSWRLTKPLRALRDARRRTGG